MIAPGVADEIRRLLGERNLSQRMIARRVGVSRGTVNAICLGKRPDTGKYHPREDDPLIPAGPLERCPGCGGLVHMPCLLCRIRAWQEGRGRRAGSRPAD